MSDTSPLALSPCDLCIGNFIESMGNIEMVTGILKVSENNWRVAHSGWAAGESLLPEGILYNSFPIPLTKRWKICFGIDNYELPEWIKYVHEVQNYFMWALHLDLSETMNWDLLPSSVFIDLS